MRTAKREKVVVAEIANGNHRRNLEELLQIYFSPMSQFGGAFRFTK
jgi:hypothetical protein